MSNPRMRRTVMATIDVMPMTTPSDGQGRSAVCSSAHGVEGHDDDSLTSP